MKVTEQNTVGSYWRTHIFIDYYNCEKERTDKTPEGTQLFLHKQLTFRETLVLYYTHFYESAF